jgi:hypothetical protein
LNWVGIRVGVVFLWYGLKSGGGVTIIRETRWGYKHIEQKILSRRERREKKKCEERKEKRGDY